VKIRTVNENNILVIFLYLILNSRDWRLLFPHCCS